MKRPHIPPGARIVRTYSELRQLAEAFYAGHLGLLILVGKPGISKTSTFVRSAASDVHVIGGWNSPLGAFIECFRHRHQRLVLDDAESFWATPAGRVLLRSLCESAIVKTLRWTSTTPALKNAGVPEEFTTTSTVALIVNRFVFGTDDQTRAILDRAHLVYFDPTPLEIHRHAATWFGDQEIFDHISRNLQRASDLSSRTYVKAWELKQAGQDWKSALEASCFRGQLTAVIQQLETDATLSVEEKARRFMTQTGKSRATYFAKRRKLHENGQLLPIDCGPLLALKVQGIPPVRPSVEEALQNEQATSMRESLEHKEASASAMVPDPAARRNLIAPDDDPRGWAQRRLRLAFRQQDWKLIAQLQQMLRRLKQDG